MRRLVTLVGFFAVVVMVLALAVPVTADDTSQDVGTTATVGAGAKPYVCAKFETPDHSTAAGTQILPVPGGDRVVKFYVIVGHPNELDDIARVDVTVRYADGAEKFQLVATKNPADGTWTGARLVPWSLTEPQIDLDGNCSPDTDIATAMTHLDSQSRVRYGKDQFGVSFDLAAVLYDLKAGKQLMLEFQGLMNNCQPAQAYTVEAVATDAIGTTGDAVLNRITFLSIVALEIDFETVDFGNIKADQTNRLLGDADPETAHRPSVKNIGNDPGRIQLTYDVMVNGAGKTIEDFDGSLGASGYYTPMKAGVPTVLLDAGDGTATVLPPCTWTQLDFSVDPPYGTMGGTYSGMVNVTILHY